MSKKYLERVYYKFTYEDDTKGTFLYKTFKRFLLGVRFVLRHIFKNTRFFVHYCIFYFQKRITFKPKTILEDVLLNHLKQGKSLIRFGDGEVALMNGVDVHFQKAEKELSDKLKSIVSDYFVNDSFVLSINTRILEKTNTQLRIEGIFRLWLPTKVYYYLFFPKQREYGDAHMFYVKDFFKQKILPIIAKRHVVIVTKGETIGNIKRDISDNQKQSFLSLKYIEAPNKNAFSKELVLIKEVDNCVSRLDNSQVTLLFSCGPASKVLAHHYVKLGFQSLDIGHGLEIAFNDKDYSKAI